MSSSSFDTPLPNLNFDAVRLEWSWPQPPFARCVDSDALATVAHPCRIETLTSASVDGELVDFDPTSGVLSVRIGREGEPLALAFAKFRRLTLTVPWQLAPRAPNAPVEHVPPEAQERSYTVALRAGGVLTGRTRGFVKDKAGVFLFVPTDEGRALLRQFVPAAAMSAIEFGESDEEDAAKRWVRTPEALLAAIDAQRDTRVMPLGEALLDLGLVSRGALDVAMREQTADQPLGERLIAKGLIDRADLQTALAHKMGYPLVDLARFPIDAKAMKLLPESVIQDYRALPLMQEGQRLIVAVDDLKRVAKLQSLQSVVNLEVVPVLAPPGRLTIALSTVAHHRETDVWVSNVPTRGPSSRF